MDWKSEIGEMLGRYTGTQGNVPSERVEQDFDNVATKAPADVLKGGIADAFRSDQTPPFPQMLSQIFGNSGGQAKASILNMLIGMLGPQILASILGRKSGGGAGGGNILTDILGGGRTTVTPEEAEKIDPSTIEDIAAEAEQKDPSVVDTVSDFYAQHPTLVKGLGVAALAFVMSRLSGGGPFGR